MDKLSFTQLNDLISDINMSIYPLPEESEVDSTSAYSRRCDELCIANGWTLDEYDAMLELRVPGTNNQK